MRHFSHVILLVLWVLCCAAASAPAQTLFFDSFEGPGNSVFRGPENSLGSLLTVSQDVVITSIAVRNSLSVPGNMRFLIFDHATHDLLFATDAQPYPADGMTWKKSYSTYFLLRAGQQYDVGAISDVGATWSYDSVSTTQGGVSSANSNPNFATFASPTAGGHSCCDGSTRRYGLEYPPRVDALAPPGVPNLRGARSTPGG
jgi:hypothetical protein